jgi:hypothetical protein
MGKSGQDIKNFVATKFSTQVSYVLKSLDNSYGHIYFSTEKEAGIFYKVVQGKEYLHLGRPNE